MFTGFTSKHLISNSFQKFQRRTGNLVQNRTSTMSMTVTRITNNFFYLINGFFFPMIPNRFNQHLKPHLFTGSNTTETFQECSHRIFQDRIFGNAMLKFSISTNRIGIIIRQNKISSPHINLIIGKVIIYRIHIVFYLNYFSLRILSIH